MCGGTSTTILNKATMTEEKMSMSKLVDNKEKTTTLKEPSILARYTCASILVGIMGIWMKYTFVPECETPGADVDLHSYVLPLCLTTFYLISLPLLRLFTDKFLLPNFDMKLLLKESMILYNVIQVIVNFWMVYRIIDSLVNNNHPFIGDPSTITKSGTTYVVWVHYCNKYLEYLDTYFMVIRGKYEQVSFLHVYHHYTISWAWWFAMLTFPGGDSYFGALCNSWIHVMMYSYYALALCKIPCPWKKYITQAQLIQFCTVVAYSIISLVLLYNKSSTLQFIGYAVQIFEMVSLFILFMYFYRKTYNAKKKNKENMNINKENKKNVTKIDVTPTKMTTSSSETSSDTSVTTEEESEGGDE